MYVKKRTARTQRRKYTGVVTEDIGYPFYDSVRFLMFVQRVAEVRVDGHGIVKRLAQ